MVQFQSLFSNIHLVLWRSSNLLMLTVLVLFIVVVQVLQLIRKFPWLLHNLLCGRRRDLLLRLLLPVFVLKVLLLRLQGDHLLLVLLCFECANDRKTLKG